MIGNKSTVLVMIGMLVFTMVFASWVGAADGGDPPITDPSYENLCPKMKDKTCTADGKFASGNPATAETKALERCNVEFTKCVTSQDAEDDSNKKTCHGERDCVFDHGGINEPCALDGACTTSNGITTCKAKGKYDRTSYSCEKKKSGSSDASI